jgi:hypothetical protein
MELTQVELWQLYVALRGANHSLERFTAQVDASSGGLEELAEPWAEFIAQWQEVKPKRRGFFGIFARRG